MVTQKDTYKMENSWDLEKTEKVSSIGAFPKQFQSESWRADRSFLFGGCEGFISREKTDVQYPPGKGECECSETPPPPW